MTIWFTSDEHHYHRNIISYCQRPFSDIEDMSRSLVDRHNTIVKKEDEVWHLGDFSLSEKAVPDILPQQNGTHYLVAGNHDKCWHGHKKYEAAIKRYIEYGFKKVLMETRIGPFLINHMPYAGDSRHEERYAEYRPKDQGSFLLHGHIHQLWKINGKQINVGCDVWDYTPVSFETLLELANLKG